MSSELRLAPVFFGLCTQVQGRTLPWRESGGADACGLSRGVLVPELDGNCCVAWTDTSNKHNVRNTTTTTTTITPAQSHQPHEASYVFASSLSVFRAAIVRSVCSSECPWSTPRLFLTCWMVRLVLVRLFILSGLGLVSCVGIWSTSQWRFSIVFAGRISLPMGPGSRASAYASYFRC